MTGKSSPKEKMKQQKEKKEEIGEFIKFNVIS